VTGERTAKSGVCRGYSLVELVIVLACASILLSAGVPNIFRLRQEWTLWGGARLLESSLQWGRMHAIAANTPMLFQVDGGGQHFYWADPLTGNPYEGSVRHLPAGVRIADCPRRPLRFYQHGNAAPAGTYVVEGEAGSYSVVVAPGGRIRIQRN
jgi:prepilin-type N-terminal cleavage/methylation domain-containing protein